MSRKSVKVTLIVLLFITAILFLAFGMVRTAAAQEPGKRIVELRLEAGVVSGDVNTAGGLAVVRVAQGEDVELRWTSDEATGVHLHGYNIETDLSVDGETVMPFKAKFGGRFAIEAHSHGGGNATILYIEVRPK